MPAAVRRWQHPRRPVPGRRGGCPAGRRRDARAAGRGAQVDRLAERLGPACVRALRGRGRRHGHAFGRGHPRAQRDRSHHLRQRRRGGGRAWCEVPARPLAGLGERCVGITMLGQTTPGVMRVREALIEAGQEPVIFHANGVGRAGDGEADRVGCARRGHRLHPLGAGQLPARRHPCHGPDRLRVAGATGCPRSSCPAASTSSIRARASSCPSAIAARKSYFHNPVATLVRLSTRRGDRARPDGCRALERGARARPGRRTHGGLLARRRRGRRPLGPGGRPRVRGRAAGTRCDPTSPSSRSTRTWTTRTSPNWSQSDTCPSPGARPCRMTDAPSPTACSTSPHPTSLGSRSGRTSSWCRSAPASSTVRTSRSGRTRSPRSRSRGAPPRRPTCPTRRRSGPATHRSTCASRSPASAPSPCARPRSTRSCTTSRAR